MQSTIARTQRSPRDVVRMIAKAARLIAHRELDGSPAAALAMFRDSGRCADQAYTAANIEAFSSYRDRLLRIGRAVETIGDMKGLMPVGQ